MQAPGGTVLPAPVLISKVQIVDKLCDAMHISVAIACSFLRVQEVSLATAQFVQKKGSKR